MKLKDLKRGMRCTYRNGDTFTVSHMENGAIYYLFARNGFFTNTVLQEDLTHMRFSSLDVVKVEDITENGYETIWEREEEKYYLKLPFPLLGFKAAYLYYNKVTEQYFIDDADRLMGKHEQNRFTLEEIDMMSRQGITQLSVEEELE